MDMNEHLKALIESTISHLPPSTIDSINPFLLALDSYVTASIEREEQLSSALKQSNQELVKRNMSLLKHLQEHQRIHERINQSNEILNATLNASQEGILVIGNDNQIAAYNTRYLSLMYLTKEDIEQLTALQLFQKCTEFFANPSSLYQQLKELQNPDSSSHKIYRLKDNRWYEIYAYHHRFAGIVWMIRDISELHKKDATIAFQAYYDQLTELPNRTLLNEKLQALTHYYKKSHQQFALCYLDLDGFKTINEGVGHMSGDIFLCKVAEKLKEKLGKQDILARVGGDEFVILLVNISDQSDIEQQLRRILSIFNKPIAFDNREYVISASVGISVYPSDGVESGELMRNADIAMYQAKANGKQCYHFFTRSMEKIAQERMSLENNLRRAINDNELSLFYQPKVALRDSVDGINNGHLHSFEALLRWPQADGGYISPENFIHIAEDAGLIRNLGFWTIETACEQANHWLQAGNKTNISINISPKQFLIPSINRDIVNIINNHNIPFDCISIEITESLLMQDLNHARQVLNYLRNFGITIYLDDFGTGFSSLNYLKNLSVDAIKIDRTFIKDIQVNHSDQAIAASIITLAKNLNMLVVAEGIECAEQANFLIQNQCDLAQGYYYGPPSSARHAELFFDNSDIDYSSLVIETGSI